MTVMAGNDRPAVRHMVGGGGGGTHSRGSHTKWTCKARAERAGICQFCSCWYIWYRVGKLGEKGEGRGQSNGSNFMWRMKGRALLPGIKGVTLRGWEQQWKGTGGGGGVWGVRGGGGCKMC